MHHRIILRGADYRNSQRKAEIHDEVYKKLEEMFNQVEHEKIDRVDTKFFVDEVIDNFLEHDGVFNKANMDIWISRSSRDVTIKVTHNGMIFNPLADNANCPNIKAAAERLTVKVASDRGQLRLDEQFGISFGLK